MADNKIFEVKFRRRRSQKTNYRKRLALLKAKLPRLVVRRMLNNVVVQLIGYKPEGDEVLVGVNSQALKKFGWNYHKGNLPSGYLAGLWIGKLAKKKGIDEAILDLGLQTPVWGSVPFAVLKGFIDAGVKSPHGKEVLPSNDRVEGKHIVDYAGKLDEESLKKKFSGYYAKGLDPKNISRAFAEAKQKILEEK